MTFTMATTVTMETIHTYAGTMDNACSYSAQPLTYAVHPKAQN